MFSRSGRLMKYIRAPPVNDKNSRDSCSWSLHWPSVAYSSNWLTQPSKSPFPSYFSGLKLKAWEHRNVFRLLVGSGPVDQDCCAHGFSYCRTRGQGRRCPGFVLPCARLGCQTTGGLTLFLVTSVPLIIVPIFG